MSLKKQLAVSVGIVVMVMIFISTAFAQDHQITHTTSYSIDGRIDFKKQAGHICNTGAEMKQVITGDGQMEKSMSVILIEGKLTVSDDNDFVSADNALTNLTVTTAIELCTPPKLYTDPDGAMIRTNITYRWDADPLSDSLWLEYWEEVNEDVWEFIGEGAPSAINQDWEGSYIERGWQDEQYTIELTKQIWAASVTAYPGHVGKLTNDFSAAYGPPMWAEYQEQFTGRGYPQGVSEPELVDKNKWAYGPNRKLFIGPDFVGDYFTMSQQAYTSQGEVRRFIDISSPYSHAMLYEDMSVVGVVDIVETFKLQNILSGDNVPGNWWQIFDLDSTKVTTISAKERYLTHGAQYTVAGSIDFKKQAGHKCNTGAEMKQTIVGDGELAKKMDIHMIEGLLVVDDNNDFTTAVNASANITVSSVVELCAPPKQFMTGDVVYLHHAGVNVPIRGVTSGVITEGEWWASVGWPAYDALVFGPYTDGHFVEPLLHPYGLYRGRSDELHTAVDVSEQIWAVSVEAEPGQSGLLEMAFEAAHGPYGGYYSDPNGKFKGYFDGEYYEFETSSDTWWTSTNGRGIFPVVGSDYVGNYFNIEQVAKTTGGVLKRYIDISSPWTHGYLMEDMTVTGTAEVKETFEMKNLPAGNEGNSRWWDLSERGGYTIINDYYLPGLLVNNFSGYTTSSADTLIQGWLNNLLWFNDMMDLEAGLLDLYRDGRWVEVLNTLETELPDFSRSDAPDPNNLIELPPFIVINFPWPYLWWEGLF